MSGRATARSSRADNTAADSPRLAAARAISCVAAHRRRWENFKANRRGYCSLWVFLAQLLISLFAELIANDKPIYIHVNGNRISRCS